MELFFFRFKVGGRGGRKKALKMTSQLVIFRAFFFHFQSSFFSFSELFFVIFRAFFFFFLLSPEQTVKLVNQQSVLNI